MLKMTLIFGQFHILFSFLVGKLKVCTVKTTFYYLLTKTLTPSLQRDLEDWAYLMTRFGPTTSKLPRYPSLNKSRRF